MEPSKQPRPLGTPKPKHEACGTGFLFCPNCSEPIIGKTKDGRCLGCGERLGSRQTPGSAGG